MMRGRKPKPAALHIVDGTTPKGRDINAEPTPALAVLKCPPDVKGVARREWNRIAPKLFDAGLLTDLDRSPLALYCDAWGRLVKSQKQIKQFGEVVKSPKGYPIQNPWLAVLNKATEQLLKSGAEFGMSPVSRGRVSVAKPKELSEFQKFMNR